MKYKLVPEEPTEEMGMAAYAAYDSFGDDVSFGPQECIAVYKAMLSAAPSPPTPAKDGMSERAITFLNERDNFRRAAFHLREYAGLRQKLSNQWDAEIQNIVELAIRLEALAAYEEKEEGQ